jgi:A/G-specific adenine glycosylase
LLAWYDANRRELPWRARPGQVSDPYRVWLSEIMLQQTTVAAVGPYYARFLQRWPSVEALASAPLDDVLAAWAGLGYYARARNLHRAAQIVTQELQGDFPPDVEGLRQLPGIGAYTAGAIAAIAFGAREIAVDANAERVLARFFAIEESLPKAKPRLREVGQSLLPQERAGDFVQALMDLGATVCTPRSPACRECPWMADCRARALGIAERLPHKAPKRARPLKRGVAFVAHCGGAVRNRTAWCHDATTVDTLERRLSIVRGGDAPRAVSGGLDQEARNRAPRLHAFRAGDRGLRGAPEQTACQRPGLGRGRGFVSGRAAHGHAQDPCARRG